MDQHDPPDPGSPAPPTEVLDPRGYHGKPWTDSYDRERRPWTSYEDRIGGLHVTAYGVAAIAAMSRDWDAGRMSGFQRDTGRGPRTWTPRHGGREHRPGAARPRACDRQARPRARRTAASSRTSGSDPPDDDGEPPRPPRLELRRHPTYGLCSAGLLDLLEGEVVA